MLKTFEARVRMALRERFVLPHYHAFVRVDSGQEHRVRLPKNCELDPEFVADPFLYRKDASTWLFFEGLWTNRGNRGRSKGVIGCLKREGDDWRYCGVALEESWHLSYPQLYDVEGHVYMIPESGQSGAVSLYECVEFPLRWVKCCDLIVGGCNYVDASLVQKDGLFYMVVTPAEAPRRPELWFADRIKGPWTRHSQSDNVTASMALRRNGGGFVYDAGRIYRIAQDCDGAYGRRLFRVPVMSLSRDRYEEGKPEELSTAIGWAQPLAHHTYNRVSVGTQTIEVVDRHYSTMKCGIDFLAAMGWCFADGLRHLLK